MRALPSRLLAALPLPFLFAACGDSPAPSETSSDGAVAVEAATETGESADLMWEVPPLPGPYSLTIDGQEVDAFVVTEFLTDEWSQHYLRAEDTSELDALTDSFYAQPAPMLAPLVYDWLLLREHLERFPGEVDAHDFEHFVEGFRAQTGAAAVNLQERIGEEELMRHLERRFRLQEMNKQFVAGVVFSEEDIAAEHERRLQAQAAEGEFTIEELRAALSLDEPQIRGAVESSLLATRAQAAADVWLADVLPVTVVEFSGPDGRPRVLDVPVRSPESPDRQE